MLRRTSRRSSSSMMRKNFFTTCKRSNTTWKRGLRRVDNTATILWPRRKRFARRERQDERSAETMTTAEATRSHVIESNEIVDLATRVIVTGDRHHLVATRELPSLRSQRRLSLPEELLRRSSKEHGACLKRQRATKMFSFLSKKEMRARKLTLFFSKHLLKRLSTEVWECSSSLSSNSRFLKLLSFLHSRCNRWQL